MPRPFHASFLAIAQRASLIITGILLLLATGRVSAAPTPTPDLPVGPRATQSQSMQFVVQGLPMGPSPLSMGSSQDGYMRVNKGFIPLRFNMQNMATSQVAYVRVDPAFLAVSCERIKTAVLKELGLRDEWTGRIFVNVYPVQQFNQPIDITTIRHRTGWSYRVDMPDQVERGRLIRAIVQVILREIANRGARNHAAELPPWLMEGMASYLQATSLSTLPLEPESSILNQRHDYPNPAKAVRELLKTQDALTFNELSWPTEEQLGGEEADFYRGCSQFFVSELLRAKDGRARMSDFLRILPQFLNWQIAFLRAYQGQFETLLDVDKWWALDIAQLTSRDVMITWTFDEAFRQLDDTLAVSAELRVESKELPMNTLVKLQQVLLEWPVNRQTPILQQKVNILQNIRLRAPMELLGLVDNYRICLETLLKERQSRGKGLSRLNPFSKDQELVESTIRRLDDLDIQRDSLRSLTNATPAQLSSAPSGNPINPAAIERK